MKFALNYSHPAVELLHREQISFDLWKCPDWPEMVDEALRTHRAYVHFSLNAGQNNIDAVGLDKIEALLARTETPYINMHIAPRFEDLSGDATAERVIEAALRDVNRLVKHFGAERVILENIPYPESAPFPNNKPEFVSQPEVIAQIVRESGAGLLLDIGHARRYAIHVGADTRDIIAALPTERLREIHITGVGPNPLGGMVDHLAMTDEDWALFEWVLGHVARGAWPAPHIVACEYGGVGEIFAWRNDPQVLLTDVPRMVAMVRAAQPVGITE